MPKPKKKRPRPRPAPTPMPFEEAVRRVLAPMPPIPRRKR